MHDAQPRDGDREAKIHQWETYDLAHEVLQHYLKVYVFASDWGDACFVRIDFQTRGLAEESQKAHDVVELLSSWVCEKNRIVRVEANPSRDFPVREGAHNALLCCSLQKAMQWVYC